MEVEEFKEQEFEYHEEGVINQTIGAMIALFVGLGVVTLVVILVGVLGAKAYSTTQADITAITQAAIKADVNQSIVDAFAAYGDAVAFIGIIVLALVFFLVLALLGTGMRPFSGGGGAI